MEGHTLSFHVFVTVISILFFYITRFSKIQVIIEETKTIISLTFKYGFAMAVKMHINVKFAAPVPPGTFRALYNKKTANRSNVQLSVY